jgi:hypothetical protein
MPTIDIPDRICPHCGGTRWKIEYEKRPYWIRTRYRCAKKSNERSKNWHLKNPEKSKELYRLVTKRKTESEFFKTDKYKTSQRLRYYKDRDNLTDRFLKHRIAHKSILSQADIPQELVEIKRKQLLLTRQIKNNVKNN